MFEECREKKKRILAKKKILLTLQKKKMLSDQLVSRNSMEWPLRGNIHFHLPVVLIVGERKMLVEVEMNKVKITSEQPVEILDDVGCLESVLHSRNILNLRSQLKK